MTNQNTLRSIKHVFSIQSCVYLKIKKKKSWCSNSSHLWESQRRRSIVAQKRPVRLQRGQVSCRGRLEVSNCLQTQQHNVKFRAANVQFVKIYTPSSCAGCSCGFISLKKRDNSHVISQNETVSAGTWYLTASVNSWILIQQVKQVLIPILITLTADVKESHMCACKQNLIYWSTTGLWKCKTVL